MIKELVEYLTKCDDAYYNTSNPLVSDATYDAMIETLRKIDPTNEYLKKVGAKVKSDKVGRMIPMGTLSKYHTEEEVLKWLNSEGGEILVSPKYDGFAVELVYEKGRLISASTRGDGNVGEDVLTAMMRVQSVPIYLTKYSRDYVIVRGEAIIPARNHEEIKKLGYTAMRNAVPGIVRSNRADALGYVDFVAYEFIDGDTDRHSQRIYYSKDFIIEDYMTFNYDEIDRMQDRREELRNGDYTYELDGVVLKTRIIKEDDLLNPTHMIAWKYKSNRRTTILRDIEYQMGLTGYFTPIGIFDEVEFQGAKLTRASLGNMTRLANEFDRMTIGSVIEVSRRGDIIPYIEELILTSEGGLEVGNLTVCPHCGKPLAYDGKEPHCVNKACPEKLRLQICQYAKSVGIKGIGDKLVRGMIDAGYIQSIVDIYRIDPSVVLNIPRQGTSSVEKWKNLQDKTLSPYELLTAYPFLDLGGKIWEKVLSKYNFNEILNLSKEDLMNAKLRGIGESKIDSIISQVAENKDELNALYNMVCTVVS